MKLVTQTELVRKVAAHWRYQVEGEQEPPAMQDVQLSCDCCQEPVLTAVTLGSQTLCKQCLTRALGLLRQSGDHAPSTVTSPAQTQPSK